MVVREDEQMVEAVLPGGADEALREAFALGERTGVRMISTPIDANTASKLAVNFVSRSRTRKRTWRPASSSSAAKLRATWVTHRPVGLAVTPSRWTTRRSSSMTNST